MRIINVPIEPYDARYTKQWYRWFQESLLELKVPFTIIDGVVYTNKINTGSVLDVYGTHYYKFTQLTKIMNLLATPGKISDNDVFLFHDLWFPGIEALQYVRNMTGRKFKITGILHAGTWDENDFTYQSGMRPWARRIEQGWLTFFDKIFVGSEFHKDLIMRGNKNVQYLKDKIVVTGLPFNSLEVDEFSKGREKEDIIVFPHRIDPEKQPELFSWLELEFKDKGWKFIKTAEETNNKHEYYKLLARAKVAVSFAKQETFGYAMLEAMANSCFVFVPSNLSYATMDVYQHSYYADLQDLKNRIEAAMASHKPPKYNLDEYEPTKVIQNMLDNI